MISTFLTASHGPATTTAEQGNHILMVTFHIPVSSLASAGLCYSLHHLSACTFLHSTLMTPHSHLCRILMVSSHLDHTLLCYSQASWESQHREVWWKWEGGCWWECSLVGGEYLGVGLILATARFYTLLFPSNSTSLYSTHSIACHHTYTCLPPHSPTFHILHHFIIGHSAILLFCHLALGLYISHFTLTLYMALLLCLNHNSTLPFYYSKYSWFHTSLLGSVGSLHISLLYEPDIW
jgi:hypothetical protein